MVGHAVGEPTTLNAMCDNYQNYRNVEIMHEVPWAKAGIARPRWPVTSITTLCSSAPDLVRCNSGRAGYMPGYFHTIPRLIKDGELKINVALCTVSRRTATVIVRSVSRLTT